MRLVLSPHRARSFFAVVIAASVAGCGEQIVDGSFGPGGSTATGAETTSGAGGAGVGGANIEIHLRASTAPFPHADGLSGETPLAHASSIRSLELFKDASDPSPLVVFDLGANGVEAGYDDGDDTLVATVKAKTLPKATYTLARVVHNYVRYRVAATAHSGGISAAGEFDNLQVLSDGSMVDGTLRDHGYFEYKFVTQNLSFPLSGTNAPTPEWSGSGGFSVKLENGQWAYYFPVTLPIDPDIATDVKVVLGVNMNESFRWQDQSLPDYAPGVFDATATSFEPVMRFGANSFAVTLE